MAAPTFIQEAEATWNAATTPRTTASFDVLAGDVLVAFLMSENTGNPTPTWDGTISGGSLTWTERQELNSTAEYCYVLVATATVDADKSMTVSFTRNAGNTGHFFGGNVLTFRSSDGVGASSGTNVADGAPSLSITTTQDNSAVVVANGDWNAADGTTRTWRTVNGITPSAAGGDEVTYFRDSARYTVYGAYYSDAGTAGAKTVGISSPGGQKYAIAAVEVKGTAGAPAANPARGNFLTLLGVS